MKLSSISQASIVQFSFILFMGYRPLIAVEKSPLILEGAEYIHQKIENRKTIVMLEGNVRWAKGESRLRCGRAKYIEEDGLLYLSRDVHLVDEKRNIVADSVKYVNKDEYAVALGNVLLNMEGGDVTVRSDSMDYDLGKEEAWAFKRPRLTLQQSGSDGIEETAVTIYGDRLHALEDHYMAVIGDVDILGDSLSGRSDSLFYDINLEKIFLLGSPWIEMGSYRLEGNALDLYIPGRVLLRGMSRGSARGEQREPVDRSNEQEVEDTLVNWIEADTIILYFLDERIDSLLALPDARSFYQVHREDSFEENYAAGDEIRLVWDGGELDVIRVSGRGEGVYLKKGGGEE
jgi:hypothetical protein